MRRRARVLQFLFVKMARVCWQRRARQKLSPPQRPERDFVRLVFARACDFERAAFGEVAFEVRGVNLDAFDLARSAEPYDAPVMSGAAPPLRLPPVAHVSAATRHDEVVPA